MLASLPSFWEIKQSLYLTMDASENSTPPLDLMSFKNDKTVKI